jgi:hypothetical protein
MVEYERDRDILRSGVCDEHRAASEVKHREVDVGGLCSSVPLCAPA